MIINTAGSASIGVHILSIAKLEGLRVPEDLSTYKNLYILGLGLNGD
ncbi:substrate-binding domain-containing protein [Paenibacillus andongensis]|nr:substrate-binding domain-containing protein [Paenibacillus andongensis]